MTYGKRFHPKKPFYEKMKMTKKRIVVVESFVKLLAHLIVITPTFTILRTLTLKKLVLEPN